MILSVGDMVTNLRWELLPFDTRRPQSEGRMHCADADWLDVTAGGRRSTHSGAGAEQQQTIRVAKGTVTSYNDSLVVWKTTN